MVWRYARHLLFQRNKYNPCLYDCMNLLKQALDGLLIVYGTKATEPWFISHKVI